MGLLSGILGNASEINAEELEKEISPLLIDNETVEKAFKLIRDKFVFTNKRLIMIDVQGVTGRKIEYHSLPYSDISHFSTETAGHFDLNSELKIWIRGHAQPIIKQFKKGSNLEQVQKTLATFVLNVN